MLFFVALSARVVMPGSYELRRGSLCGLCLQFLRTKIFISSKIVEAKNLNRYIIMACLSSVLG